jgi:RNA polymerase sigma factor (TIGR02999 family)
MAAEAPSQTLQATALVHEAYLRVVGENGGEELRFSSRGHFFATAARAMRRILIERARARGAQKRGGQWGKLSLEDFAPTVEDPPAEVLDVCEALEELEQIDQRQGTVANLRIVASFTIEQIAEHCHISRATAERDWSHAKLWLLSRLRSLREDGDGGSEARERGNATR